MRLSPFLSVWIGIVILFVCSAWWTWDVAFSDLPAFPTQRPHVKGDAFPKVLVDSFGLRTALKAPPQRIVSALLVTDEILLDLISPQRLVRVSPYAANETLSNCLEKAKGIPPIGNMSVEKVLSLRSDLILTAHFADFQVVSQLRRCGAPVFCFGQFDSLKDVRVNVLFLGQAVGAEQQAKRIAAWMDAVKSDVRRRVADVKVKPRVLYYYLQATAGRDTIVDELIRIAGGVNVAAEAGIQGIKDISAESIPGLNADFVIVPTAMAVPPSGLSKPQPVLLSDPVWQAIRSARPLQIYGLPQKHLGSVSHHVVKALAEIAHVLHPNRVPADLPSIRQLHSKN